MIEQFKTEYKDYKYFETSAKINDGIEKLFQDLGEDLYKILNENGGRERNQCQRNITIFKYKKPKKNSCTCLKVDPGNYKKKD